MKLADKYLFGYLISHVLLAAFFQAFFCVDLKIFQLGMLLLVFAIALSNPKKISLDRADIIIAFLLAFCNIYFTLIDLRGFIFFKMTYVLFLSVLISKVVLPNISIKNYLNGINFIYSVLLIGLIIEYLLIAIFGNVFLTDLLMCNGELTGVRGYIPQTNITNSILPYHISGLNSLMMGSQTASQLSVIIFVWFFYKYKSTKVKIYKVMASLGIFMLFLSPSLTSLLLLFVALVSIFLIYLKDIYYKKTIYIYQIYFVTIILVLMIYIIFSLLVYRYQSIGEIYDVYIFNNLLGFGYFDLKEILLGINLTRQSELFGVGEIAFLDQLMKYGFLGIGVLYAPILYFVLRAANVSNQTYTLPNLLILMIFIIGNIHYPVMFGIGLMELFAIHLGLVIYLGSSFSIKK